MLGTGISAVNDSDFRAVYQLGSLLTPFAGCRPSLVFVSSVFFPLHLLLSTVLWLLSSLLLLYSVDLSFPSLIVRHDLASALVNHKGDKFGCKAAMYLDLNTQPSGSLVQAM